jgi:hypothetical protein
MGFLLFIRAVFSFKMTKQNITGLKLVLLTSIYDVHDEDRKNELQKVLDLNMQAFDEIYLLHNGESEEFLAKYRNPRIKLYYLPSPHFLENQYSVAFNSSAYLYSNYFRFARNNLAGYLVTLSNQDIAFPTMYRRHLLNCWTPGTASVFSRKTAMCTEPCPNKWACQNSCKRNKIPSSYDSFLFSADEITEDLIQKTNHPQNMFGAENMVAALMRAVGGFRVYNLCPLVTPVHFHCKRDWSEYEKANSAHICKENRWETLGHGIKCWNPPKWA